MKTLGLILLFSLNVFAANNYPIEIGLGWEYCQPNSQGQKICEGQSPIHKNILIPLIPSPDNASSYGYFQQKGTFRNIGFQALVKITHFENRTYDDMITMTVFTWPLNSPQTKFKVESEMFARRPQDLNRVNLTGQLIGNEEYFSTVILGVRAAR